MMADHTRIKAETSVEMFSFRRTAAGSGEMGMGLPAGAEDQDPESGGNTFL